MEEEKLLENITKSITERLKVPIILTYVCVLIIHNWDVLFFLFFDSTHVSEKIEYIKNTYGEFYYARVFNSLIIAVVLIILFTMLNTAINFCLKWFYRKDKEITSEIESYEQIQVLTEQLSQSLENIKKLNSQIKNLTTINENLNSRNINLKISDISEKDYSSLLAYLNTKSNKEKLLYSLKELIINLRENPRARKTSILNEATYQQDMNELFTFLTSRNLIQPITFTNDEGVSYSGFNLGTSFKDFLKKEI